MSTTAHIEALKEKHSALEAAIHDEELRPHPDDDAISNLKKQKLLVKDEIQRAARG
ncbi:MAG: YdcH family protein [Rhodospirillaceae bacterium]